MNSPVALGPMAASLTELRLKEHTMDRTPLQIVETVDAAKLTMGQLEERLSGATDVLDLGDHSVIRTTVRRIEELLSQAEEYEEVLRRQLARTNGRITASTG